MLIGIHVSRIRPILLIYSSRFNRSVNEFKYAAVQVNNAKAIDADLITKNQLHVKKCTTIPYNMLYFRALKIWLLTSIEPGTKAAKNSKEKNEKQRTDRVRTKVRGVSCEVGRGSTVGRICEAGGFKPGSERVRHYGWWEWWIRGRCECERCRKRWVRNRQDWGWWREAGSSFRLINCLTYYIIVSPSVLLNRLSATVFRVPSLYVDVCCTVIMAPYGIGQAIIYLPVVSSSIFLSIFLSFPRLISAVVDWMSTIRPHHGVALVRI